MSRSAELGELLAFFNLGETFEFLGAQVLVSSYLFCSCCRCCFPNNWQKAAGHRACS